MTVQGIAHIEYHCADAEQAADDLATGFGFARERAQPADRDGRRSVHLAQGRIRLRLVSALRADHPVAEFVRRHGDGVAVLALGCTDPDAALDRAVRHGATVLGPGLVAGFGDVALRFVTAGEPAGGEPALGDGLLEALDHTAICVPAGELAPAVRFCEAALGFHRIFGEYIEVGAQGMDSSVVQSASGEVTFTLLEPDTGRRPGQIDTFLDAHRGTGVQHLAFRTPGIADAVRTLRSRGVEFLTTPGTYYDGLLERLGSTAIPVQTLRELDVLVDQDHGGQLFQIFTRSVHARRTFFLELIERQGAGTFGTSNIKALYEAVERQNAAATV
ncbi:4-hydroxyphenylpyruvate dioxygenase [Streptacidiphilus sp. PB12-B1b]|uniref:4-hydroxyphenylpyruvate dioxygenase n=1 Tax=Streptacidiphilus sp. PB12-B1b TaxID=2705012 RepID=UPI0015FA23B4|nr:4-hydroxyphenylpyruvate dioxygenase [Streptacidiphilus sp. PB12-B1b]QMU76560.1 4-hydroxyphenylpyruvate dioxygenase [Streptacidiphilus sp. PB12-B1b]